ncbi:MAG TPA: hypothetical protein VH722_04335, partial [Alphaproteobacteria bacterium]|nr:hypothetical protein [Alphaproteobacteria bacterium]
VSQEVYVDTGARQLPWTSSSLSRVLYFGRDADAPTGDDAQIIDDRRKLLLDIATVPQQSKAYVEAVAAQEDLKLADLYSMLEVINSGKGSADATATHDQLLGVAKRVREVLDDPILSGAPTDPELARLDGLANKAIAAGAFKLAFGYRQQEAKRAAAIENRLDSQQAQIDKQQTELNDTRRELAGVYARVAEAAMYTLQPDAEAAAYNRAAKQTALFDPALSLKFRLRAVDALVQRAQQQGGDFLIYPKAVAAYQDMLEQVDRDKDPRLWADIQSKLAWGLMLSAGAREDEKMKHDAVAAASAALSIVTPQTAYADWSRAQYVLVRELRLLDSLEPAQAAAAVFLDGTPRSDTFDWSRGEQEYANDWIEAGRAESQYPPIVTFALGPISYATGTSVAFAKAADAFAQAATACRSTNHELYQQMLEQEAYSRVLEGAAAHDLPTMLAGLAEGREGVTGDYGKGTQLAYPLELFGDELAMVGKAIDSQPMMREALAKFAQVEKIFTETEGESDWAMMRGAEGVLLSTIGEENRDRSSLQAAIQAYSDAIHGDQELNFGGDYRRAIAERAATQSLLDSADGRWQALTP